MNKEPDSHDHETQSELVNELRKLVSSVRTADFDERISQGKPLTDLIQQIREIREDLSSYQVDGERMQAGLRPKSISFGQILEKITIWGLAT